MIDETIEFRCFECGGSGKKMFTTDEVLQILMTQKRLKDKTCVRAMIDEDLKISTAEDLDRLYKHIHGVT